MDMRVHIVAFAKHANARAPVRRARADWMLRSSVMIRWACENGDNKKA
jgi:hypothetical protein